MEKADFKLVGFEIKNVYHKARTLPLFTCLLLFTVADSVKNWKCPGLSFSQNKTPRLGHFHCFPLFAVVKIRSVLAFDKTIFITK